MAADLARGLSVARAAVRLRHRSRGSPCPRPAGRRRPRLEGSDQPHQRTPFSPMAHHQVMPPDPMCASYDRRPADSATGEQHKAPGAPQWCRTIAPLHNLTGPSKPIVVGDELVVRPFTGEEREALVGTFGGWSSEIP